MIFESPADSKSTNIKNVQLPFVMPDELVQYMVRSSDKGGIFRNEVDSKKEILLLGLDRMYAVYEGMRNIYGSKDDWDEDWYPFSFWPILHFENTDEYLCYDYSKLSVQHCPIIQIVRDEFPFSSSIYKDLVVSNSLVELLDSMNDPDFWLWG